MSKVAVIGGGAAGMFAAIAAAQNGHQVSLFEHNEKLGKKLYITGKGRCNFTNACDPDELLQNIPHNSKFMYSAIHNFDNRAVLDFFSGHGLEYKVERGNRVFPESDHASDVTKTLERALRTEGVRICLNANVTKIRVADGRITGISYVDFDRKNKEILFDCDAVVMACGGVSYPSTGSDGSGYELVKCLGHSITELRPSLIGMTVKEDYIRSLQGLSLRNINFKMKCGKKVVYEEFGELLFTHQGISGPVVLTASSKVQEKFWKEEIPFEIDLKAALSEEQLDKRIQRDFADNQNRRFKNALSGLLPSKIIPVIVSLSEVDPEKQVNAVTKQERGTLVRLLKHFPGTITGLGNLSEAIITRGGVKVKEVNPSTMESKMIGGLYFCGEMLDVDAVTGGFNLQIAWSTGYLAGTSIT